jgi:HrpA-like RNA helicase
MPARRRFAAGLRAAGVRLTCVFDPSPLTAPESARKLSAWGARMARSTLAVGELHTLVSGGAPSLAALASTPPPELFVEQVKRTLVEEGVQLVVSIAAEADDQLVACVRSGAAYAVLSNDTDFCVAEGCRLMHLDMMDAETLMDACDGGVDTAAAAAARARAWVFEPAAVASALGLRSVRALFEACCLAGQDATGELCDRLGVMPRLGVQHTRGRSAVAAASAWVASQPSSGDAEALCCVDLESGVPALCGMGAEDAAAWAEAIRASRAFYLCATDAGADDAENSSRWVSALPPAARDIAAAVVRDALPTWALAVAAHRQCWVAGVAYERPWGADAGGGCSASHRPLRARLYARLGLRAHDGADGDADGAVVEHCWGGDFWGSGVVRVRVVPDVAASNSAAAAVSAAEGAAHPWARLRALLHTTPLAALPLPLAADDPALTLPSHEAFAALTLRYLFSLKLASSAAVVRRLSAWQAAACVAVVASTLTLDAAVRAGDGTEPPPAQWESPSWRALEVSALLQSCVAHAYAAADVAGPFGARRNTPPPAALFTGAEFHRLFRAAEAALRAAPAADATAWPPPWWADALPPAASALASRLGAAARHGLPPGLLSHAEADAGELSALDELLQRWASAELSDAPGAAEDVAPDFASAALSSLTSDDVAANAGEWDAPGAALTLPVEAHLPALLAAVSSSRVVCISGATGCGKSTVVPLALLRAAGARGRVIVTQPRRIAAVSLARRVAHTLAEPLGDTVGFAIGQERAAGPRTRLLFVTTGWLLRVAASAARGDGGAFAHATHIVLDEAHDRSLDADFLSLLLKRRLASAAALNAAPPPKLVVMSATLQADVFGPYFMGASSGSSDAAADAPVMHVGARRFPVREVYLDELASALGVTRPALLSAAAGEAADAEAMCTDARRRAPRASRRLVDVAVQLAMHTARPGGTTLVFLPGAAEIEAAQLALLARAQGRAPLEVFALHSLVPRDLQAAALARPTPGRARVLLSTDIAESSLTLPDVTVVIDTCLKRGHEWVEKRQMTSLSTSFASRASLAQRAGRAGRVQPGTVIRLLPRAAFARLPAHDAPEMQRVALDGVVLRAKHLLGAERDSVQALLAGALSPPPPARVTASLVRLAGYGALTDADDAGQLTALGAFAAAVPQLPLPVARALLLGIAAGAAPDAVILAAALCLENSPFKQVLSIFAASPQAFAADLSAATRARLELDGGRYSEPLTWVEIYRAWASSGRRGAFSRAAWRRGRAQLGMRAMRSFATAVRALARDVPRAAAAAGVRVAPQQAARLAAMASLGAEDDDEDDDDDAADDDDVFDEEPQPQEPPSGPSRKSAAASAAAAAAVEAEEAPGGSAAALLRLLSVAACAQNMLVATRRTRVGAAVSDSLRAQGVAVERSLALRPPSWFRARGAPALRAALADVLGAAAVERIASASVGDGAAAAAVDVAPPRLSARTGAAAKAAAAGDTEQSDALFVQMAPEAPAHGCAAPLLADAMPPAAKCLLALAGGRRLVPLPVPARIALDAPPPAPGGPAARAVCADEEAGRAPTGVELPHPLGWAWLRGEPSSRGRLPTVDLTYLSALHGVSESAAAAAARRSDSGRRYAAAASLVSFEEAGGIQARVLTLLPTRALDAELLLLALAPRAAPPRLRVRALPGGGSNTVVAVAAAFGAPGGDAAHAELCPWHIGREDLAAVNALRAALSAVVLSGDAAALPAALTCFFAACDAVAARPQPAALAHAGAGAPAEGDAWFELEPQAEAQGAAAAPWPPFSLAALDASALAQRRRENSEAGGAPAAGGPRLTLGSLW